MDYSFSKEEEAFRQEVRSFLARELPSGWPPFLQGIGLPLGADGFLVETKLFREMQLKLGKQGWLGMTWPKKYGGQEAAPMKELILLGKGHAPINILFPLIEKISASVQVFLWNDGGYLLYKAAFQDPSNLNQLH